MRINLAVCFCFLFLVGYQGQPINAQTPASVSVRVLRNNDILLMVGDGINSSQIVQRIQTSNCNFDVFPPVLRDLRRRGVPETVLLAMTEAPNGPPVTKGANVLPAHCKGVAHLLAARNHTRSHLRIDA